MTVRNASALAVCVAALGCTSSFSALAQTAPFTIRKPLDGSHVREKVRIEIPRDAIGKGGFVAFYLDSNDRNPGSFMLGIAPSQEEDDNGKAPFTYIWDTKAGKVSDGEHTIKAILYEPASGANAIAMTEKSTTAIHVIVENKIKDGPDVPTSFLLRYNYKEGAALEYGRSGKSSIVSRESAMGGIRSDVDLMSAKSKLLLAVEDVRFDAGAHAPLALVRNKLTQLSVLNGNQEITLDPTALSNSMYQELLPNGKVNYETGTSTGLTEFLSQGLPVNNTLELPMLPEIRVARGDKWSTPGQRLDIPGLPPALQPVVTLENQLVDLEYEGGYPCVKIHQKFSGALAGLLSKASKEPFKALPFAGMEITGPSVTYDRDIYVAYNSGTLVRTTRTLLIKGRTTSAVAQDPAAAAGAEGGGGFGAPGLPGGGAGRMASMGGMNTGGMMGMMTPGGNKGGKGMMTPGGGMMAAGGPPTGGPGRGGMNTGGMAGMMMGPGGNKGGGMMMPGGGKGMMGPGGGNPFGGIGQSGGAELQEHPITIRSTSDTDILSYSGGIAAAAPGKPAAPARKSTGKAKKSH
jgi:hypothetical protein